MKVRSMILLFCLTSMLVALTVRPAGALFLERWIIESVVKQKAPQDVLNAIPSALRGEKPLVSSKSGLTESQLVELGRFLFNYATFNGNGRTCATCHPPTNNFTIDPQYIATLPDSDPLFVAENNPDLKGLENPQLMRSLGLICENVDGFDQPCVFRGVPHTLALRTTTTPPQNPPPTGGNVIVPGTTVALANSTGWSADGAPIDVDGTGDGARGELRLFALGAIVQHFTRTLNRTAGVDFRVPSDLELDALLEYQLSLGRQEELDLRQLTFKNPIVEFGKDMFQDVTPTGGRCAICHNNGGATAAPGPAVPSFIANLNVIANTGVEHITNPPAYLINPDIPVDGGFGKLSILGPLGGFGDGTFDAPPAIECAATPPYMHNNSVPTLEAAVGFYCSPEFKERTDVPPPDGVNFAPIILKTDLATSIAAFLRAVGCMELIDRGIGNNNSAINSNFITGKYYVNISLSNTRDAIKVLKEGVYLLYPDAQELLADAYVDLANALIRILPAQRNKLLNQANVKLTNAKNMISQ